MKKLHFIVVLCLAGCAASQQYIREEYAGIAGIGVSMPDDTYTAFDKPSTGLIMIKASVGTAIKQGAWAGLTFGSTSETRAPRPRYEAAARKFLADSGRAQCTITDGYPLADVNYEFRYTCPPGPR